MTREVNYTIQIGTAFDWGQELIWTLIKEEPLRGENVFVPRPRFYRRQIAKLAEQFDGTATTADDLNGVLPLDLGDPDQDLHIVLKVTELMEPQDKFCPAGDWFFNLGKHAAQYRGVFAPSKVKFMISLRNPAMLVSDAWSSGNYPGFDVIPPDPFDLHWATVLRDLRAHCPDVPIIAWSAEDAPLVWGQVLDVAFDPKTKISVAGETHLAKQFMNEEGHLRLTEYLDQHENMPLDKRARVISTFLKYFPQKGALSTEMEISDWNMEKQNRMQEHYAADLAEVALIDGVTLITA